MPCTARLTVDGCRARPAATVARVNGRCAAEPCRTKSRWACTTAVATRRSTRRRADRRCPAGPARPQDARRARSPVAPVSPQRAEFGVDAQPEVGDTEHRHLQLVAPAPDDDVRRSAHLGGAGSGRQRRRAAAGRGGTSRRHRRLRRSRPAPAAILRCSPPATCARYPATTGTSKAGPPWEACHRACASSRTGRPASPRRAVPRSGRPEPLRPTGRECASAIRRRRARAADLAHPAATRPDRRPRRGPGGRAGGPAASTPPARPRRRPALVSAARPAHRGHRPAWRAEHTTDTGAAAPRRGEDWPRRAPPPTHPRRPG